MTTPTFPAYMPAPMIAGFKQSPDFGMLVTQMDAGPDKQRPRNSVAIITRTVQFIVNSLANRNAFEAWVRDSLSGGSLWFNWTDPLDGATKLARIVGGKVEYVPSESVNAWAISFSMETYG